MKTGKGLSALLICAYALAGCTTFKPPQISYDDEIPALTDQPPSGGRASAVTSRAACLESGTRG